VPDQHNLLQVKAFDLGDDVADVGLLACRPIALVGQPGQCQRMRALACRAQFGHDLVPGPPTEPGAGNQHEVVGPLGIHHPTRVVGSAAEFEGLRGTAVAVVDL
jgi:hypothetical protein